MNRSKLIFAVLGTALLLSCSEDLKPIERESLEEYQSRLGSSSSSEAANISSSSDAGSSSSSLSSGEEQKASVSGVSQKGPFLNNSSVTLYELRSNLAQTGRSFQGMTDDKGSFEIKGVELDSPYALLKADGFYRNEVSGENSVAPITLYAIADMGSKSTANVNILTHLEYHRVLALVKGGKSLAEAKKQALGEILSVFGIEGELGNSEDMNIFGTGDSNAALLAISILLQSDLSEGSFSALLADFSRGLEESGAWGDKTKIAEMARWASSAILSKIRINILGWQLSPSVPDFEKHITAYVAANSSAENCAGIDSNNEFCYSGLIYQKCGDANGAGKHDYDPVAQFCHNNYTVGKCGGKAYEPPKERCNYGVVEKLCGTDNWYDPSENYCYDNKPRSCGKKPLNPVAQFCHSDAIYEKCGGKIEYDPEDEQCCGSNKYATATQFCYNSSKVGTKCGSRTDEYNPDLYECKPGINPNGIYLKTPVSYSGESYEAVLVGSQTWLARNLNHNASGSRCYGDNTGGDNQNRCGTYGRLYDWATAMDNAPSSIAVPSGVRGVCPSGWHLPSRAEWDVLLTAVGGESTAGIKLKTASGWKNATNTNYIAGTDEYGFSALPGGYCNAKGEFPNVEGFLGHWWSATEVNASTAYYSDTRYNFSQMGRYSYDKSFLYSVRCLQD